MTKKISNFEKRRAMHAAATPKQLSGKKGTKPAKPKLVLGAHPAPGKQLEVGCVKCKTVYIRNGKLEVEVCGVCGHTGALILIQKPKKRKK